MGGCREIYEVWSWNFDAEFGQLLAALGSGDVVLALDTEFPGFLREEKQSAKATKRYAALRQNCDNLRPIQLGIAIANADGTLRGTWCFNLLFDVYTDLYTEASMNFLSAAGLDFPRHGAEGIDPAKIGRRLRTSLAGRCRWVTFQGSYDFGYMLRLLTNRRLPKDIASFQALQHAFFPDRYELRDELPRGSLDTLLREFGVDRVGTPHTAGSDALATLELFFQVTQEGPKRFRSVAFSDASTTTSYDYFDYGYNWSEEVQAREVGQGLQDWTEQGYNMGVDMWEEAVHGTYERNTAQGQWQLLSTPGPQVTQPMASQAPDAHLVLAAAGAGMAATLIEDPIEQQVCQQEAAMQLMMGTEALTPVDYRLPEQRWHVLPSATWAGVVHPEMMFANGSQLWQAVIAG